MHQIIDCSPKFERIKNRAEENVVFYCPACETHHVIDEHRWTYTGTPEAPTVRASVLVVGPDTRTLPNVPEAGRPNLTCHIFITDGQIQYLNDCTHAYAGKIIPLPDME